VVALLVSALWPAGYHSFVDWHLGLPRSLGVNTVHGLVVNGLLTLFFFPVGLELSDELRVGHLRTAAQRLIPFAAAFGGMVGCAGIAVAVGSVHGFGTLTHAWGVPMATDIAFTLGALSLVRHVPSSLRLFVLALAIADDLLSVVVLACTGHEPIHWPWLGGASVLAALLYSRLSNRMTWPVWWLCLPPMWFALARAGVEPCLAGVVVGTAVPFGARSAGPTLMRQATPFSTWLALPLFAFVAAGVTWSAIPTSLGAWRWGLGLLIARIAGKVLGITGAVAVLRACGRRLPDELSLGVIASTALLCAIGLTVPLVFATTVFGYGSATYQMANVVLITASLVAAALGIPLTSRALREYPRTTKESL
jgi:NhaA family Na+:H+ antiporter